MTEVEKFTSMSYKTRVISAIDKRIQILNDNNDLINEIKKNANIPDDFSSSIFRPKDDLGMLLFKKDRKSKSEYTLNLFTLKPTENSVNKTMLSEEIIQKLL